jgi:hypothetical protein
MSQDSSLRRIQSMGEGSDQGWLSDSSTTPWADGIRKKIVHILFLRIY